MFVTESFNVMLDDLLNRIGEKLQISDTDHQMAETRYHAIGDWLSAEGSSLAIYDPSIYSQGSLRIGTTVKPRAQEEFDLDLVCQIHADPQMFPNPVELLNRVEGRLREHGTYKNMLERKNRCVRINYANEFHMDILPACPDRFSGGTCLVVPDRDARNWKPSNPKGYAAWFENIAERPVSTASFKEIEPLPEQEALHLKATLKRAVQLIKRWRDIHYANEPELAPISIVLTTLAAQHYGGERSVNDALAVILRGIITNLPSNGRLVVCNPSNPKEDLSERWDTCPENYRAFVSGIVDFERQWIDVNEMRGTQLIERLKQLFGVNVTERAVKDQADFVERQRRGNGLGIHRTTGGIIGVTSPSSVSIRPNTFYGR